MDKLKGIILSTYDDMAENYACKRLKEEADKLDINLKTMGMVDSYICSNEEDTRTKLDADFIITRYKWNQIKNEIGNLKIPSYNKVAVVDIYQNKYNQLKFINSKLFKKPKYILATMQLDYDILVEKLGSPFIMKGLSSSRGKEIYLIKSITDYLALREKFPETREFLFEETVKESYGKDLRLFAIRGEAVGCIKRESFNDFRSNIALGGKATKIEIDSTLQDIAAKIYQQTGLDYAGIDLLFGKDAYYLCEVNVMPGFKALENTTGINIANKMLSLIKNDLKNK